MLTAGTNKVSPTYSSWLGKPVVLLILIRHCQVSVPCRIVGETGAEVRVRIHPGWELEVRKDLILAIEEDGVTPDPLVN